jgi:hypothetical protein
MLITYDLYGIWEMEGDQVSNINIHASPKVGGVTSKRNGVILYCFSHVIRAITIKR